MGLILPNSGELLLALEIAAVRAEALLSPDLHVEHSPLDHADMGVVELIEDALRLLLQELQIRDWRRVQLLLNNRVLRLLKAQYYGSPSQTHEGNSHRGSGRANSEPMLFREHSCQSQFRLVLSQLKVQTHLADKTLLPNRLSRKAITPLSV